MQLTYGQYFDQAIAGQRVDIAVADRITSFAAESVIAAGFGVVDGAIGGKTVKAPVAAIVGFRGVALLKSNIEQDCNGLVQYKAKDSVSIINTGKVWVVTKGVIAWDGDVYLIFTGVDAGKFISAAGANQTLITGAKFRSTTTGDGIAVVELK